MRVHIYSGSKLRSRTRRSVSCSSLQSPRCKLCLSNRIDARCERSHKTSIKFPNTSKQSAVEQRRLRYIAPNCEYRYRLPLFAIDNLSRRFCIYLQETTAPILKPGVETRTAKRHISQITICELALFNVASAYGSTLSNKIELTKCSR